MNGVELLPPAESVPDNPRWHELRRAGITASEIAAVLGISPWESPFSLFWRKREGWEVEETPEMVAGRYAEPVIVGWFADHGDPLGNLAVRPAGLYGHQERPWQMATPDGLVHMVCADCDGTGVLGDYDSGVAKCACYPMGLGPLVALLEAKYVIGGWALDGWGEPGGDDIPVWYRAQALWQLDVLGLDEVFVCAWHGAEFRVYRVRRDERDLRMMRAAARAFLDRLDAGDPPPIDGHAETIRTLRRLHPSIVDKDIEVPVEFAEGYRRARALASRADAAKDRYEARARAMLGDARRLVCNGHLVCSRSVYDQSGSMAELDSLDDDRATVDRLNPGRAASYLIPKTIKKARKS